MNSKQRSIADGWIELESDPGLFTLLIEDFGVKGVEVEEVYDLQSSIDGPVYGFILLFKWLEGGRRKRRNSKFELASGTTVSDEDLVNSIFFAHQIIMNSCATHAILSILMNREDIELGKTLSELKRFTAGMSSENKGAALNNMPELVLAHNKHARPDACRDFDDESSDKGAATCGSSVSLNVVSTPPTSATTLPSISSKSSSAATKKTSMSSNRWQETFHFASFLPINGHLYEMDSLKPYPIDHGKVPDEVEWHHYFLQLLYDRIVTDNEGESHEIRYNLMALVPRRLENLKDKLALLISNRTQLIAAMKLLVLAIDGDVFRRELQMSSFSSRKKLSDAEILRAAECLLKPKEIAFTKVNDPNNNSRRGSLNRLVSSQEDFLASPKDATAFVQSENPSVNEEAAVVTELECVSSNSFALLSDLICQCPIENYEIKSLPASHFYTAVKQHDNGLHVNSANVAFESDKRHPETDVVELSVNSDLPSTSSLITSSANHSTTENLISKRVNLGTRQKFASLQFGAVDDSSGVSQSKVESLTLKELIQCYSWLLDQIADTTRFIDDQEMKRRNYRTDDQRRTHDYDEFTATFFEMMLENGLLPENDEKPKEKRKRSASTYRRPSSNSKKRLKVSK